MTTPGPEDEFSPATDWTPEHPRLRGETQVPDVTNNDTKDYRLDELPHRERVAQGLDNDLPDDDYDPDEDDLEVIP